MALLQVTVTEKSARPSGNLKPIASPFTSRYDSTSSVIPSHSTISPGFCSFAKEAGPCHLPPGWSTYTHPEGKVYFVCQTSLRIVTEVQLYDPDVQEKIQYWIAIFNDRLTASAVQLPESTELFLELDDAAESCLYYLVDYNTRVEFWIEKVSAEDLNLPPAASDSHMRLALEEHYWVHIDRFPCHRCEEVKLMRDELISIFIHARADHMTSAFSTFPYTATQCAEFIDLLNSVQCCIVSAYSVSIIARLWAFVSHNRFATHYGQEHARLSRDQSILREPVINETWWFRLASRLMFRLPDGDLQKLNDLNVDNLVYVEPWKQSMRTYQADWKLTSFWTFALLIMDVLLLLQPSVTRPVVLASVLCCNTALVSAIVLLTRHHGAEDFHASDAANYLTEVKRETSGYQWTALAFSLPRALFFWALGAFSFQGVLWLMDATNIYVVGILLAGFMTMGMDGCLETRP
ncbi:uncharacterized protein FIBRA_05401 [Fibroporia radiculosa]|uniref:WW domain-containing protein n=1 Tax=Fibroporia radiculosa TaxID=599839 RepID=J4G9A5_9APHY|nr:uncharacterized protein FIBRA_05401 [Fibroporia radiculosa]CCM03273.1 predicted protein [Fibroporia radiculosa]